MSFYTQYSLFKPCFSVRRIPSVWLKSIIFPIPRCQKKVPLTYRGISMLSSEYKLYSFLHSEWLMCYHLLEEEQNGFCEGRVCIDHIFTVCTLVRNILKYNEPPLFVRLTLRRLLIV